ncbi:MAG: hypothetical protein HY695_35300 [Deltaproteobacteria bacterium]|nr:hypothetical protein [Deltaproteobacteria bacterium]
MNIAMTPASDIPPPPRPRRWRWFLLLGVVFLSGTICGAGVAAVVIHRAVQQAVHRPDIRAQRATQWITKRLHLDAAQQERVRVILERHTAALGKIRQEIWPRVIKRFETTEGEINELLSPSQRETWHKMTGRLRKNWLPAGDQ